MHVVLMSLLIFVGDNSDSDDLRAELHSRGSILADAGLKWEMHSEDRVGERLYHIKGSPVILLLRDGEEVDMAGRGADGDGTVQVGERTQERG